MDSDQCSVDTVFSLQHTRFFFLDSVKSNENQQCKKPVLLTVYMKIVESMICIILTRHLYVFPWMACGVTLCPVLTGGLKVNLL